MILDIRHGDCRAVLPTLESGSVQTCVTSPPYWGLRDYGVEGQLGLERTPEEYVSRMVDVFREVKRVLREDGTLWLNLGDSYSRSGETNVPQTINDIHGYPKHSKAGSSDGAVGRGDRPGTRAGGLAPKQLVGIPWRVAFALQADGWVLRSEIIWAKPNPMPESVTDRPTKAHEQLFMFSKARWSGPQVARLSVQDARWLALLIDTEGNIVSKHVTRPDGREWFGAQVAVANTSRALIDECARIAGCGAVSTRDGLNAPVHYWQASNRQAAALLRAVYPHLIVKRRQAAIAIRLQEILRHRGGRGPDRLRSDDETALLRRLWQDCKVCNRFGTPDLGYVPEPDLGRWRPERYYYDAEAIKEDGAGRLDRSPGSRGRIGVQGWKAEPLAEWTGRNRRSVWTIATQPFPEAHFAVMPEALVEPCVLAGTSPQACEKCGAPWERVSEREQQPQAYEDRKYDRDDPRFATKRNMGARYQAQLDANPKVTKGWRSTCSCENTGSADCIVLDPFAGSGTVGKVAARHGRCFIGCELNPEYVGMARRRIAGPLFAEVEPPREFTERQLMPGVTERIYQ